MEEAGDAVGQRGVVPGEAEDRSPLPLAEQTPAPERGVEVDRAVPGRRARVPRRPEEVAGSQGEDEGQEREGGPPRAGAAGIGRSPARRRLPTQAVVPEPGMGSRAWTPVFRCRRKRKNSTPSRSRRRMTAGSRSIPPTMETIFRGRK